MNVLAETKRYITNRSVPTRARTGAYAAAISGLDSDTRTLISIFGRSFFMLALGAIAIVTISGQFPWFLLPLGLFLFFGCCLSWR